MEANKPTRRRGDFATSLVKPGNPDDAILAAMREMIAEGMDLTMSGKPEVPALSARLGFEVNKKLRDRLMGRL